MRHWPMWALMLVPACQEFSLGGNLNDPDELDGHGDGIGVCSFSADPQPTTTLDVCGDYDIGAFTPLIEYVVAPGRNCTATPTVADLDGDGMPEIIGNFTATFSADSFLAKGELWVVDGLGWEVKWKLPDARLGFGSSLAVGDIDGDGDPEIVGMRALTSMMLNPLQPGEVPKNVIVAWDHEGNELWESDVYTKNDFDYATGVVLSDMDRDGAVEIIAGRVILNADGSLRGKGTKGRGSWGMMPFNQSEGTIPAVADVDLDGIEEVIVGNAMYSPDGDLLWAWTTGCPRPRQNPACYNDGMVSVANLDDDPEAEWVVSTFGSIRAHDTDGTLLWGPTDLLCVSSACLDPDGDPSTDDAMETANIISNAAIDDIDGDGYPEIVVAGGSQIVAFNHDGTELWSNTSVQDISGATGASIFDFDADGHKEVVYIDEIALYAFDGADGTVRFQSYEHASNTMMEYPVIVDVDADGSAEILVPHFGFSAALTVYGSTADGRWAPTREVWNQHAYAIDNIEDDLSIPTDGVQGFSTHNSWHSASDPEIEPGAGLPDLQVEVVDVCRPECIDGTFRFAVQPINRAPEKAAAPGVQVSVYARRGDRSELVDTIEVTHGLEPGMYGEQIVVEVPAEIARKASSFEVIIDEGASGRGTVAECNEDDNAFVLQGPFCR